jgi:hypothetical protein
MSFESALAHYGTAHETTRRQDLSKAATAESRTQDAAHFFGLEKAATAVAYNNSTANEADTAWREAVLTLLANAIALGRELDRTNWFRDPKVGLALELVRQEIKNDPVENNAFVAELLEIALDNATEIAASDVDNKGATVLTDARRALAEDNWSTEKKKAAAVLKAQIKFIQDRPVQNPLEQMSVAKGKSLAREVWKTVEPRATFWDRPRSATAVQKFAGKTPDQIIREAKELSAKIDREANEKLAKVNGGKSSSAAVQQLRSAQTVGELQKAARALGEDLAKLKDGHNQRVGELRDLRK